ncbi:unnamed protein product, partial [marine sediment metagenome]
KDMLNLSKYGRAPWSYMALTPFSNSQITVALSG